MTEDAGSQPTRRENPEDRGEGALDSPQAMEGAEAPSSGTSWHVPYVEADPTPPHGVPAYMSEPWPPAERRMTPIRAALAGVALTVVVVALAILAFVVGRESDSGEADQAASAAAISTTVATSEAASSLIPPTTATDTNSRASALGDVLTQPAGLLCRDLHARGFSYSAAVDYWRHHGQPNRMDADRNGIPCETVFPAADIDAYWGGGAAPPAVPSGLFCRDLRDRGFTYAEAVDYWFFEGMPDRMDADLNGVPCETVYPASDVAAYWG